MSLKNKHDDPGNKENGPQEDVTLHVGAETASENHEHACENSISMRKICICSHKDKTSGSIILVTNLTKSKYGDVYGGYTSQQLPNPSVYDGTSLHMVIAEVQYE